MATVVVNQPDVIEFKNIDPAVANDAAPTLIVQVGVWQGETNGPAETGIMVDVFGDEAPLLTPTNARKLARWLTRAADNLEGARVDKKSKKSRHHRAAEEDDEDNY